MEESLKIQEINKDKLSSRSEAYKKVAEIYRREGMETATKRFFEAANIEPVFLAEKRDQKSFKETRKKLQSEPGVIISNHPGVIDIFFVLRALGDRKNFKVFAAEKAKDQVVSLVGENAVISTGDENYKDNMLQCINNGEVVIFFPTGGSERSGERKIDFKRGFGDIFVKNLNPDVMVYSFHISHGAIENLIGVTTPDNLSQPNTKRKEFFKKVNSSFLGLDDGNEKEPARVVKVDEKCTAIFDWSEDSEENTVKYLDMFNLNKEVDKNE